MTKEYRPGYASYVDRVKQQYEEAGSNPKIGSPIGKNYQKMLEEMDRNYQPKYNPITNLPLPGQENKEQGEYPYLSRPGHIEKEFNQVQNPGNMPGQMSPPKP